MTAEVTFVLATYGEKYVPFAAASIGSITEAMPDADIILFWSDTPAHEIDLLARLSNRVRVVEKEAVVALIDNGSIDQVISQKMGYWQSAFAFCDTPVLVFMDTDTLLIRSFDQVLSKEFDILFTYRGRGSIALNTGVVVMRNTAPVRDFAARWSQMTNEILSSPERAAAASATNGGADQQALVDMADYKGQRKLYRYADVAFLPESCDRFNEVRCVPDTGDKHVYHFKGGWHPIILEARTFNDKRPRDSCIPLMSRWLAVYRAAVVEGLSRRLESFPSEASASTVVSELAREAGADRLIVVQGPEAGPLPAEFSDGKLPVFVCAVGLQRPLRHALATGRQILLCWGLSAGAPADVWSQAAALSATLKMLVATVPLAEIDAHASLPFYRATNIGPPDGPCLAFALLTYLDFRHRRRSPEWLSLLRAPGEKSLFVPATGVPAASSD